MLLPLFAGTLLNLDEKGQPAVYIYNDESESMVRARLVRCRWPRLLTHSPQEERRAKLSKYRYDAATVETDVAKLQDSIAQRLKEVSDPAPLSCSDLHLPCTWRSVARLCGWGVARFEMRSVNVRGSEWLTKPRYFMTNKGIAVCAHNSSRLTYRNHYK